MYLSQPGLHNRLIQVTNVKGHGTTRTYLAGNNIDLSGKRSVLHYCDIIKEWGLSLIPVAGEKLGGHTRRSPWRRKIKILKYGRLQPWPTTLTRFKSFLKR